MSVKSSEILLDSDWNLQLKFNNRKIVLSKDLTISLRFWWFEDFWHAKDNKKSAEKTTHQHDERKRIQTLNSRKIQTEICKCKTHFRCLDVKHDDGDDDVCWDEK